MTLINFITPAFLDFYAVAKQYPPIGSINQAEHLKLSKNMITQESIIKQLKKVYDPEIPVNIYDLGLIYDLKTAGNEVYILMTLTTATCPAAAFIPEEVKAFVSLVPGVQAVHVDIVYEPRWTKEKMSVTAKEILGFA